MDYSLNGGASEPGLLKLAWVLFTTAKLPERKLISFSNRMLSLLRAQCRLADAEVGSEEEKNAERAVADILRVRR